MLILYIICALIVGFILGIGTVALSAGVLIDIERESCKASKVRLETENSRLYLENERLRKKLELDSRKIHSL